ncbi:acyltransferase [Rugamonas sp. A1-17]|nr:acyltransferase [Rugamonas sp. A1-17]
MTSLLWRRPPNNFNLMRLVAAWMVLFSHSYHLLGQGAQEPLMRLTGGRMTLGTFAVGVFFAISGYLITASAYARPGLGEFLVARVRRIFPGLALVVVLSALLLGPCYSSLAGGAYFGAAATYTYMLRNITLVSLQYGLPGVFAANPFGGVVNGSLWTLPIEFSLYLAVGGGVLALRLLRRAGDTLWPLLALGAACAVAWTLLLQGKQAGTLVLVPYFLLGALCRIARLALRGAVAALMALAAAGSLWLAPQLFPVLACLAISYGTLWLARHPRWIVPVNLDRVGDLSYGTYLFAFPIQQSLVASGWAAQPLLLCLEASVLVAPAAWLCWHLVERHFVAPASTPDAPLRGART